MKEILLAYSVINDAEKNSEYPQDILERSKAIFEKRVPNGILDGKVNEEVMLARIDELKTNTYANKTIEELKIMADEKMNTHVLFSLIASTVDKRYLNVITNDREKRKSEVALINDGDMSEVVRTQAEEMQVDNPGEKLAEEIANSEPEIPEISEEEAKSVIEARKEEIEVGSPEETVIEPKDKQISDVEAKTAFDKSAENLMVAEEKTVMEEEVGTKVAQEENKNTLVAESIAFEEPVQDDKALIVQEKNVFKSIFNKVSFAMKNIVNNVKEKFGISGNNVETSNNDTTSISSSSGGIDKSVQESSVKNLTGYEQIQIVTGVNQGKSEEGNSQKREEATEERDDEIGG